MICPKCQSENVQTHLVQTEGKSRHSSVGLGGNMNNMARSVTAIGTMGMSNLVWKKSTGGSKHKFKHSKMAVCQACGHDWKLK